MEEDDANNFRHLDNLRFTNLGKKISEEDISQ